MSSEAKLRPHVDPPPVRRNRDRLREILREQPALLLTISYLMLTSLGLGYQFAFFLQFRVNILDYAEISDFLLAAIREPAVLVLGLAPLLLLWAVQRFGEWLKRRNTRFAALSGRTDTPLMRAVTYPFFIAIYFFLFALKYGERVATSIKAGGGIRCASSWRRLPPRVCQPPPRPCSWARRRHSSFSTILRNGARTSSRSRTSPGSSCCGPSAFRVPRPKPNDDRGRPATHPLARTSR